MMQKTVSELMMMLSLMSLMISTFKTQPVMSSETIYIRFNGSVEPPVSSIQHDGRIYTFTADVFDEIVVERNDIIIDGNGYNLQGSGSGYGFYLKSVEGVRIENVNILGFRGGIFIQDSSRNIILRNNITNNNDKYGISLSYASYNLILKNNLTDNDGSGINVENNSFGNIIFGNLLERNGEEISIMESNNNTILGNNMTNGRIGITFRWSHYNIVSGNNIANNYHAIAHRESHNNKFYHNNFVNNTIQVYDPFYEGDPEATQPSINTWDGSYPSGGNYWSNYSGIDLYRGPYQNETGSDGIGDTQHDINVYNQDRYPSMNPWQDKTSPITLNDYDGLWHSANFTVTLIAIDDKGEVKETYYKIDNGPEQNITTHGHPCITTQSSNNILEYWSVDSANNTELPHKILTGIKLDNTSPTIEIPSRQPEGEVLPNQSVNISIKVIDEVSGVRNVRLYYTADNETTWLWLFMSYNFLTGAYECTIPGQPTDTIVKYKIIAFDYAGNSAILNGMEPYCIYQVIPEFSAIFVLLLLVLLFLVFFSKRKIFANIQSSTDEGC